MDNRELIEGKVAHIGLWTLCKTDRAQLLESIVKGSAAYGLVAFKAVSVAFRAAKGTNAHHAWLEELVNDIGANDLLDMFRAVIFESAVVDLPLVRFTRAFIELAYSVPACTVAVTSNPLHLASQCAIALNRQLDLSKDVPLRA